jgi:hypothetical protein
MSTPGTSLWLSLHGQEGGMSPISCPSPPATSDWLTVPAGLRGGTYVEFFILRDHFSVGEDGGRRAFGEWVSWKDGRTKVRARVSFSLNQFFAFSLLIHDTVDMCWRVFICTSLAKYKSIYLLSSFCLFVFGVKTQEPYFKISNKGEGSQKQPVTHKAGWGDEHCGTPSFL